MYLWGRWEAQTASHAAAAACTCTSLLLLKDLKILYGYFGFFKHLNTVKQRHLQPD